MDRDRLTVYHGTTRDAAKSIRASDHFRPSTRGLYGRQIYFSQCIDKAEEFGSVVLVCKVDKSACVIHHERGNICCVRDWSKAKGEIVQEIPVRRCSRDGDNTCDFIECRECRTESERNVLKCQERLKRPRGFSSRLPRKVGGSKANRYAPY